MRSTVHSNIIAHRSRRGMTLVEVALSLGVLAIILVGLMQIMSQGAEYLRSRAVADRLEEVTYAAKEYVKANFVDLMAIPAVQSNQAVNVPVTGATGPAGSTLPSLQGGGFLGSTFVDQNAYGQQHAFIIRRVAGEQRLEGIITTTGGIAIPDRVLGVAASYMGADAGFMFGENPLPGTENDITGINGGWRTPAATWTAGSVAPTAGHMMASLAFAEGALVGDYLHRRDIGIPEANRMRTNLNMGSNEINDVAALTGNGSTITMNSGSVDVGPNLQVTGWITAGGNITSNQNVVAGNDVTATRYANAQRFVDSNNTDYYVDPSGKSRLNEIYNVNADFIDATALIHTGTPGGNVRLIDRLPNYVAKQGWYVTASGQKITKPICGAGGEPKITFSVITESYRFASRVVFDSAYTSVGGQYVPNMINNEVDIARRYDVRNDPAQPTQWVVNLRGTPPVPGLFSGLAMTYCYYPNPN